MPRKAKLDPVEAAKRSKTIPVKDVRRGLIDRAIQVQSLRQYEARFLRMESFRRAMGAGCWTGELFTKWLGEMRAAGYREAEGYRAALIHCLSARGEDTQCLRTPEIIKMTQGFTLQNKIAKVPVGSISSSMLKEFCSWLRKKGEVEMAILASVIFYTQGRGEEVMQMQQGDIQTDGDSQDLMIWFVRNDKRCRRGSRFEKTTEKMIPKRIGKLIELAARGVGVGELIFSEARGFCLQKLALRIKAASVILGWPKDVRFVGPHGLRHGGSRTLLDRARVAVATGMANQSKSTLQYYAKIGTRKN